jgi:hypothetical protein
VAEVAEQLGLPLLPCARQVADVALEVDPRTDRLAYREVVLLTPRQSTKTTLCLAIMVHRALGFGGRQRIVYSAQTRVHAGAKLEDDFLPVLDASPLGGLYRKRMRTGHEGLVWRTGSIQGLIAPNESAGHGTTLDLAVPDECWAHRDATVEQGVRPTMVTRPEPQLWLPSTAGTAASMYLRGKVYAVRNRCKRRRTGRTAYFEWSAAEGSGPADPATWWGCMSALGHTVREATIRGELESMELAEFCRAYLNLWPDEIPLDEWAVIPEPDWRALAEPGSAIVGQVAMAVDVTPDGRFSSIGVAGRRRDGRMHVEVIEHRPGVGWVAARAREVAEKHRPCCLIVDAGGPAGSLIPDLEAKGLRVTSPTMREVGQWTGALIEGGEAERPCPSPDEKASHHARPA